MLLPGQELDPFTPHSLLMSRAGMPFGFKTNSKQTSSASLLRYGLIYVPVTHLYPSSCMVCLPTKQPMVHRGARNGCLLRREFQKYGGEKKKSSWESHSRKEGCSSGIPSVSWWAAIWSFYLIFFFLLCVFTASSFSLFPMEQCLSASSNSKEHFKEHSKKIHC